MDLRNIQAASAVGGGLQIERQGGRLAEERNVAEIVEQEKTVFTNPQDQINFSQDALRTSVISAEVQRGTATSALDARNSRSSADQGAVKASVEAGAIISGGNKPIEHPSVAEGLSLEKLSGDLIYEYADIKGAHSAITSPLQSTDPDRSKVDGSADAEGVLWEAMETAEKDDVDGLMNLFSSEIENERFPGDKTEINAPLSDTVPPSRLSVSSSALPGAILDIRS